MLVLLATVIAWPIAVQAETLTLAWNAPAPCPNADEVRREVLRLVAPRTQFSSPISATARTEVDAQGQYVLKLETTQAGVDGERVFSGKTCRAVADAAIVTMALSLDPNIEIPKNFGNTGSKEISAEARDPGSPMGSFATSATDGSKTASPLPVAGRQMQSAVALHASTDPPAVVVIPSRPRGKIEGYLRSLVGWRWGSLPDGAGELGLSFGLRHARLSSQLTLAISPSVRSAYSHATPNAGGAFAMQTGELLVCWAVIAGSWNVSPCLGLALTHLTAEGLGVKPIRDGQLYWTSPEVAVQGSYRATRSVALYLGVAGYAPLARPAAYLGESDRIFRPGAVTYQLAGGGELRIW